MAAASAAKSNEKRKAIIIKSVYIKAKEMKIIGESNQWQRSKAAAAKAWRGEESQWRRNEMAESGEMAGNGIEKRRKAAWRKQWRSVAAKMA